MIYYIVKIIEKKLYLITDVILFLTISNDQMQTLQIMQLVLY